MTEYYVAFSIHNSHCFITANKKTDTVQTSGDKIIIDGFSFTQGHSRTQSLYNATKLLSDQLLDKGRPSKDAVGILAFFHSLRDAGWKVDDKDFIKKHGLSAAAKKPKPETKVELQPETPPAVDPMAAKMASSGEPDFIRQEPNLKDAVTEETLTLKASEEKPAFERLDGSIKAVQGDITTLEADAVINAANAQLIPGGGVDGAINRAAGPELKEAMSKIGGCQIGGAVITDAFGLQTTKHIIHAVGPIYSDYTVTKAAEFLRAAYHSAFALAAEQKDVRSVAAPLLSTGVYGYPLDQACAIAVQVAREFNAGDGPALDITFVAFDDAAFAVLMGEIAKLS